MILSAGPGSVMLLFCVFGSLLLCKLLVVLFVFLNVVCFEEEWWFEGDDESLMKW